MEPGHEICLSVLSTVEFKQENKQARINIYAAIYVRLAQSREHLEDPIHHVLRTR